MKRPGLILLLLLVVAVGATMLYLGQRDGGQADAQSAARSAPASGPSAGMMGAMHRMHEAVNKVEMSGDIDRDFVALMIPHHQSAVEMARIYLEHGKDPELRKLSQNVVASQEAEIRQMSGRRPAAAGSAAADPHAPH